MAASSKQRTNVSIDAQLLRDARSSGMNLSATLEEALRQRLNEQRRQAWLAENQEAFEAANRFIEKYGLWSDGLRQF